jgi:hypothetical protein
MSYRADRYELLVGDLDLSRPGVEYGPLTCPIVSKSQGPVLYVDYADTATLRAKAYRSDLDPNDISEVDLVWGSKPLSHVGRFHYAVASHVIEHIPDPIGWLLEIVDSLTDDGRICLAVPDKNYTFDINRPLSTTGELIEAWLEKHHRPSIKQMFDNCRLALDIDVNDAWQGKADAPLMMGDVALTLAYAQALAQMKGNDYIDSHCWIFTPSSFLDICEDLIRLKILPLEIDKFVSTSPGTFEFIVRFRRAGTDPIYTLDVSREIVRQSAPAA